MREQGVPRVQERFFDPASSRSAASHNSRPGALRQMTLRALRCDGRVPRKSRYSRSGKPPLPDQRSRGRDRGFPEEQLGLFSHPSSLTGRLRGNAGKMSATAEAPVAAPAPCCEVKENRGADSKSVPLIHPGAVFP
jgi:hypothetical protein